MYLCQYRIHLNMAPTTIYIASIRQFYIVKNTRCLKISQRQSAKMPLFYVRRVLTADEKCQF